MSGIAKKTTVNVIPALHYKDAHGAIEFLRNAFGWTFGTYDPWVVG